MPAGRRPERNTVSNKTRCERLESAFFRTLGHSAVLIVVVMAIVRLAKWVA